jgi:hypothetical protein
MPVKRQFAEALDDQLVPGAGQLPLYSFVRALPAGTVIGIEVPMTPSKNRGIGPAQRIERAVSATRRMLERL